MAIVSRAHDAVRQPLGRRPHVRKRVGIRHQRAHGRIEEARDRVHLDPAPGENAREELGHVIVALRNRERTGGAALVEPIAPGAATAPSARRRETRAGSGLSLL